MDSITSITEIADYKKHIMALHAMKFLGIIAMIVVHISFWLLSSQDTFIPRQMRSFIGIISSFIFIGYFPLSLPIIAGAMYRARMSESGGEKKNSLAALGGISLLLILLGYARNILTWGISNLFDWDILGFIGISYLLIALLSRISRILLYAIALTTLISGKLLYMLASQLPVSIQKSYFINVFFSLDSAHFFWPLIPWFAFIVFGYFLYDLLLGSPIHGTMKIISFYGALFSLLLVLAIACYSGRWKFDSGNIWGPWLFHPELSVLLTLMCIFVGFSFLCFSLYHYLVKLQWLIKPYSVGILWIFMIHTIVGYHLIQFLKPLLNPYVLYGTVLSLLLVLSWFIGRCVEYGSAHQLEFIVKKVKREAHGE